MNFRQLFRRPLAYLLYKVKGYRHRTLTTQNYNKRCVKSVWGSGRTTWERAWGVDTTLTRGETGSYSLLNDLASHKLQGYAWMFQICSVLWTA